MIRDTSRLISQLLIPFTLPTILGRNRRLVGSVLLDDALAR